MINFCKCGSIIVNGSCSNPHCGCPSVQWSDKPDYLLTADIKRGTPLIRAKAVSKSPFEDHRTGGALAWRMEC